MIQHYVLYRNATPQVMLLLMPVSTLTAFVQSKTPSDYESIDDALSSHNSQAALLEHEAQRAEDEVHASVEDETTANA